ncbi:MAG: hypothetical protein Q4G27_04865 [Flavobacteriaceae bacterium]|nr:hypothetical protein [Flavobacteriaceae bacterium]
MVISFYFGFTKNSEAEKEVTDEEINLMMEYRDSGNMRKYWVYDDWMDRNLKYDIDTGEFTLCGRPNDTKTNSIKKDEVDTLNT